MAPLPHPRSARSASLAIGVGALALACGAGGSRGEGPGLSEASPDGVTVSAPRPPRGSAPALEPSDSGPDVPLFAEDELPEPLVAGQRPLRRRGLIDRLVECDEGATTSISGTVYIPSGELPVYGAVVYVPETELAPLTPGASCGCDISGEPISSALTDPSGRFVLENVPVGDDVPIVVQVGDWRREVTLPLPLPEPGATRRRG
jgi:hypothetical protein